MPLRRHFAAFTVLLFAVVLATRAQPPPGPEEPPVYDPYPGAPLEEDPGSSLDPTFLEYKSTLGEPQEAYGGDPTLLDDPKNYPPEMVGTGPSYGLFTNEDAVALVPDCKTFPRTGKFVTPVGISITNPRYLSFHGKSHVYVGWSADAACHHRLDNPDFCHAKIDANPTASPPQPEVPANYPAVLAALRVSVPPADPKLRKLRLWVNLSGDANPANIPFQAVGDPATTGYWRLDGGPENLLYNQDYFDRLRAVVNQARKLDLVVEITFFAPFQGLQFDSGPWSYTGNKAKALNSQGGLDHVGFSQKEYFAVAGPIHDSVNAARNLRMRDFQRNVILWTIRELWCFENIWYEIANEPENQKVDPIAVADWQKTMIDWVGIVEGDYLKTNANPTGSLQHAHLIAVQPWTQTGANLASQEPRISIVSSHYTMVSTNSVATLPTNASSRLDLGAITLSRLYASRMRILGFNETKITPAGGGAGDRSHLNGVLQSNTSRPDSARAEAWEFLLSQGGTYDHWSYNSKAGTVFPATQQIRDQLVNLQAYFDKLPLDSLEPPPSTSPWVTNIKPYPGDQAPPILLSDLWETPSSSLRYWATLQTKASVPKKTFLFYNHHSTPRCHTQGSQNVEEDYASSGCPAGLFAFLSFGGYDARIWSQTQPEKRYQDTFKVNLGAGPGIFDVKWIDPASLGTISTQTIFWRMTGSACTQPACIVCLDPASCTIVSPRYTFDQLLQIVQR